MKDLSKADYYCRIKTSRQNAATSSKYKYTFLSKFSITFPYSPHSWASSFLRTRESKWGGDEIDNFNYLGMLCYAPLLWALRLCRMTFTWQFVCITTTRWGKGEKKWRKIGGENWGLTSVYRTVSIGNIGEVQVVTKYWTHRVVWQRLTRNKIMQGNREEGREWNWETSEFASLQPVFKFSYGHNNYRFLIIGWIVEVQGSRCCISFLALIFFCFAGKGGKNRKKFLVELSQTDR